MSPFRSSCARSPSWILLVIDKENVHTCVVGVGADRLFGDCLSSFSFGPESRELAQQNGSLSVYRFSVTAQSERLLPSGRRNAGCLKA